MLFDPVAFCHFNCGPSPAYWNVEGSSTSPWRLETVYPAPLRIAGLLRRH
jgi:hypothetical protein